eukprot:SAG11_NODE_1448_length_4887_cov_2.165831_4_plen_135_part_00
MCLCVCVCLYICLCVVGLRRESIGVFINKKRKEKGKNDNREPQHRASSASTLGTAALETAHAARCDRAWQRGRAAAPLQHCAQLRLQARVWCNRREKQEAAAASGGGRAARFVSQRRGRSTQWLLSPTRSEDFD